MGFNQVDSASLDQATKDGFIHRPEHKENQEIGLIIVPSTITSTNPAQVLSQAIMAYERFFNHGQTTTVIVELQTPIVPTWLLSAIDACTTVGLVIQHGSDCSHGPTHGSISAPLRKSIAKCSRSGKVWNPVMNQLVDAHRALQ